MGPFFFRTLAATDPAPVKAPESPGFRDFWGYVGIYIGVILGLCWGYIGVILGLYWDIYWGYIGVILGLQVFWVIVPLKQIECGIYGYLTMIYPKPYSIYLRGTIEIEEFGGS